MSEPRYDVIAIGNAIVDVISACDDALIEELELSRGGMMLIDAEQATSLYEAMGSAREISGGSAANTLAGASMLGLQCAFVGQVCNDQLGEVFTHDMRATGIDFDTPPLKSEPPTGRCLIFVTPDGERTMNTFLGAGQFLPASALDEDLIASAAILYLEGYVIERHGDYFRSLIEDGLIDILFVNEHELATLTGEDEFEAGIEALSGKVPVLVATKGAAGAVATAYGERAEVRAERAAKVIDTTGAGDQFAAGFLSGFAKDAPLAECLKRGAITAAEVISHYGPRPEVDTKALVAEKLA